MPPFKGSSNTKLHEETIKAILETIRARGLKEGDRLPPQDEFADQLEISRATLREALVHLASDGVIRQVHGIGTFVATDLSVVHSNADLNLSITEMIRNQGMEPATSEVDISTHNMPFETNPETGEEEITDVMCLRRVRTADGSPFAYTVAYLPLWIEGLVLDETAYQGSLYQFLQDHCNQFVSVAHSVIEAQASNDIISRKLCIARFTPILVMYQRHYNQSGQLLVRSEDYFVQNRIQLKVIRTRPGLN